jgi:hypothetical protein
MVLGMWMVLGAPTLKVGKDIGNMLQVDACSF